MSDSTAAAVGPGAFAGWLAADPSEVGPEPVTLARSAAAWADERLARAVGPDRLARLACAPGCAHCCYLPVTTTAAEVASAWRAAEDALPAGGLAAIAARARAAAPGYADYARHGPTRVWRVACPFLQHDRCAVYEARPLACRGWNSMDAEACRRATEEGTEAVPVPVDVRVRGVYANASEALARGLEQRAPGHVGHLVPLLARLLAAQAPSRGA